MRSRRKRKVVCYVGYDCTAPSLHIGHLISIMMLHWLQETGNKPIALMGGGTTRVGDPSGRDETRRILTSEQIDANKETIKGTFSQFLTFGSGTSDAVMADNAEWLTKLNYIEMLRDVGRHFSINRMLTMDSVKLRLERDQELSFIEFNYMILQSYDFVELARRYGCNLQMGGSDQWGNIVNGIDLGRRMGTASALCTDLSAAHDLVGRQDGQDSGGRGVAQRRPALGPTTTGSTGVTPRTATSERFLKLFTTMPLAEIAKLAQLQGAEINEAKKVLATEATALLHGRAAAERAAETARTTFEEGAVAENLPTVEMPSYLNELSKKEGVPVMVAAQLVKFARSTTALVSLLRSASGPMSSASSSLSQSRNSEVDGFFFRPGTSRTSKKTSQRLRQQVLLQRRVVHLDDLLHRVLVGELDVVEEAAAQEGVGQLLLVVGGDDHQRPVLRDDHLARLVDVELHAVQFAQQVVRELDVGLVDLVDQQHARLGRVKACHSTPLTM